MKMNLFCIMFIASFILISSFPDAIAGVAKATSQNVTTGQTASKDAAVAELISKNQDADKEGKGIPLEQIMLDSRESAKKRIEFDGSIGAFFGCQDILSKCKGGNAEINVYRQSNNFGLNLQAYGSYGRVDEDQYIWHKIYAGGGFNYRYNFGKSSLLAKQSFLLHSLRSSIHGYDSSQLEVLSSQYFEATYEQSRRLEWGTQLSWTTPIAFLEFSTRMPEGKRAHQSKGELALLARWKISELFKGTLKYAPVFYQEASALLGSMGTIELGYKDNFAVYGGVIFYPYDNMPQFLKDNGVSASRLINAVGGFKIKF